MRWTIWWWGGFGFGMWRSLYPDAAIWSIAFGPVVLLVKKSKGKVETFGN